MKKYLKYLLLTAFILSSFYFTEKGAIMVRSKDPLMQSIIEYSKTHNVDAVNAVINDSYIIPGLYGKRINEIKSLMKMKGDGVFNSIFLVTDNVKPDISLEKNKDKIINKGNPAKMSISFLLQNDESNILTYLVTNKIDASILVDEKSVNQNPFFEQINNDFGNYQNVEKILNKFKINTNICIVGKNNKEFCQRNKKYLVEPTMVLSSSNLLKIKNKIKSGDIILIKDNVTIDDISYLINYIKNKNISIVKLSELIAEK